MRLIDANALKAEMEDIARELFDDNGHFKIHMADVLYTLDDAPTIDAVEVVRCKDCVYWKYRVNYKGDEWGACLFLEDVEHWTEDTDFCSYGERNDKYKGGDV